MGGPNRRFPEVVVPKPFLRVVLASLASMMLLLAPGCGGGGGSSQDSVAKSAVVVGSLASSKAMIAKAASDPIKVYVLSDPAIETTVGADGTFTLRGLPEGSFVLVFTQGGTEVGRLPFAQVAPNQQITITVQLAAGEIVLVDEDRRGIGDAGVELEGPVQNVIATSLTGDSRFVISGKEVVARPGVTAIRQGDASRTVEDIKAGTQVHVTGTKVANSTDVLAYQIIIQATDSGGGASGAEKQMTICHIPPGNPAKKTTITIGESAWPAHQAHGDTEGACKA